MKTYKKSTQQKSIFGSFEFELGDKMYQKETLTLELFTAICEGNWLDNDENFRKVVVLLIGEEEWEKCDGKINPLEVCELLKWIGKNLIPKSILEDGDVDGAEKND